MLKGSIDVVSKGHLVGWLTTENGKAVQRVDCLIDGEFAGSAEGFFRQDLKDLDIGDGSGGIRAWVPASFFDGRVHRVTLVGCEQNETLGEVSKELTLPRLMPLNPNPFLQVGHDGVDGWSPTLSVAEGLSFQSQIGQTMPHRYSRYTRLSLLPRTGDAARAGLVQKIELPPHSESRRVLVILGKTPTLTPLLVEVCQGDEVTVVERVTLGPSWTTYYVSIGKTEEVSELRLWLEAGSGIAIVDLGVVGVTEWDGKTSALPPPPNKVDAEGRERAVQSFEPLDWNWGSLVRGFEPGGALGAGWWFDCTASQAGSFSARLVTSGSDLGVATPIKSALALRHAPLSGFSRVTVAVKRGAFLSLERAELSVALSFSQSGDLVPARATLVVLGRVGDERTSLWSQHLDSPLPGRTATLVAKLSAADMALLRAQATVYPSFEIGIELCAPYAMTLREIRVGPIVEQLEEAPSEAFEDASVAQQSATLVRSVERKAESAPSSALLDVVVPVFNATEFVEDNLRSLLRANDGSYRILVVDDASGARTRRLLADFARAGDITLLSHATNEGFTRSVNDGLQASGSSFVVTLNSDTVVPRDWHRRLLAPFERFERLGIAGPLSSAASWQSVPFRFAHSGGWLANSLPFGLDVDELQHWLGETWQPNFPQIRLLNGFCLCMRRAMLDEIGFFDEVAFPVGYGEENDLCLRATAAGWQLRVVDDLYVFHAKSKSFGSHRGQLTKAGTSRLKEKHPDVDWSELDGALRHHEGLRAVREHFRSVVGAVE